MESRENDRSDYEFSSTPKNVITVPREIQNSLT